MDPIEQLNAGDRDRRLETLRRLSDERQGAWTDFSDEVNNHVHTIYSFSPYSPSAAAWMARSAGLRAVGSVDHDSIAAARETIDACRIVGIGSTVGCEIRVSFSGTPIEGRKINNPDSPNLAYIVFHGVPIGRIDDVDRFLAPIRAERNARNRAQTEALDRELRSVDGPGVSFDDVLAVSMAHEGGGVTERHLLYAACIAMMRRLEPGPQLRRWVEARLGVELADRVRAHLDDGSNPHYVYDLLGALKSTFLPRIFIQPGPAECVPVADAVAFANAIEAVPAYAYLGDVGESPTGDKKAELFEDSYLDLLFATITDIGFRAVTYMPPRNTVAQLRRVQSLCASHGLMEISGVDINSSRQTFTCPEILRPEFRHLIDATWALIAHEKLVDADPGRSLFTNTRLGGTPLPERIVRYARVGRAIDPSNPGTAVDAAVREGV
ncbi:MAG: PHP domain-containing protein [Spirochaetaceae bacterium]|nr:MAG: PHP domain-containing protein [Spirochaetaceae bacterium]